VRASHHDAPGTLRYNGSRYMPFRPTRTGTPVAGTRGRTTPRDRPLASQPLEKDWQDPRDAKRWIVQLWEPTTLPTSGGSIPLMITFRLHAAFDVYSTALDRKVKAADLSDEELTALLDRARERTRLQPSDERGPDAV
jgi:hypothetical protein